MTILQAAVSKTLVEEKEEEENDNNDTVSRLTDMMLTTVTEAIKLNILIIL